MVTTSTLPCPARLSDSELLAAMPRLAAREREATVALIAHLAELDARGLYLAEGCSSLFVYCTQVLRLSEHAAYGRIEAARAARRYPVLLERLADGSVTLTTVTLLAPHLTAENHRDLLDQARHKSRREVEALVAALRPLPPVPPSIRRLPAPRPVPAAQPPLAEAATVETAAASPTTPSPLVNETITTPHAVPVGNQIPWPAAPASAPTPPARSPVVAPLAPDRYKVQFTASAETHAKLRLAQDLLRHQIPDGDVGQVLDRALTVLVETLTKQKVATTDRPRKSRPSAPGSRHIPASVRRAVWARDGGRCAFVSRRGRRCTERGRLEFHHVRPYATGGPATVENIELRCLAHNAYEARQVFGPWEPSLVREPQPIYVLANRAPEPARTRFEPSWTWACGPPPRWSSASVRLRPRVGADG